MTRYRRTAEGGFTLIELVVVLAVLAVAATLVLPAVGRGTEALRLRSQGGRVAALLRDARQQAIARRQPARVALDRARNTVAVSLGETDSPSREIELSAGVRISAVRGPESLAFSPRGITRDARWVLEAPGGHGVAIDVDGITGKVAMHAVGQP